MLSQSLLVVFVGDLLESPPHGVCRYPKKTWEHKVCVAKTKAGQNLFGTKSPLFRAWTIVQFINPNGPLHHDNGTVQWINGSDKLNKEKTWEGHPMAL